MKKKNQFLFLYPIKEYFDVGLGKDAFAYLANKGLLENTPQEIINEYNRAKTQEEKLKIQKADYERRIKIFKPIYSEMINRCISQRYRQDSFEINFAVFDDCEVDCSVIDVLRTDRTLRVGVTKEQHFSKKIYPSQDYILNQLSKNTGHLRIAGFHTWDCVEKLAKRAYERKIDVLVDEDLTQFFVARVITDDFKDSERNPYSLVYG